jgi:hypothetical protein
VGKYEMYSCVFGGKHLVTTFKKFNELLGIVNGRKVLNSRAIPSFYEGSVARRYFPV